MMIGLPLGLRVLAGFLGFMATFLLALIATYSLWKPWLLNTMASNNFLIGKLDEGTAKVVMHYGEFERVVLSWKGYHLTPEHDVVPNSDKTERAPQHWIDKLLPGSLFWIGLPFSHSVYEYHFQWTSIRQGVLGAAENVEGGLQAIVQQDKLEDLLISRDKMLDYILLKEDIYGITFKDVEDSEMIPLSSIALMTIKVVNVYKALFESEQWLEQITNFLRSYVKDYVGARKFAELAKAKSREQADLILGEPSPKDGMKVREYILQKWGIEIQHLNLVNITPGGKLFEAFQAAAATGYLKEQEATGIRKIANAEAYRVTKVTDAIKKGGPDALAVRTLEAYEKMGEQGNTIVIGGEKPVQMLLNSAKTNSTNPPPKEKR